MKRVKRRSAAIFALVGILALGFALYLVKLCIQGPDWVGFAGNKGVYHNGVLDTGSLYDRNGLRLAWAEDGVYGYAEDWATRVSTLHATGDYSGNIGTGALSAFAHKLIGYNLITGTYSLSGQGNKLYLSIDAGLNETAYAALGGRKGCVALYNYRTGEVLCMVSSPSYDPANPPEISEGDSQYAGVYINRFLSSTYTPGSTFKIVTAAAALEKIPDIDNLYYDCAGSYDANGDAITCTGTHGSLSLKDAMAVSCNCYFAQLALELGPETIAEYAEKLGLLDSISVSGIDTARGSFEIGQSASDIAWSGIGQYNDLVNPCAMMTLMGAIAGEGVPVLPRLIHSSSTASGFPTGLYVQHRGQRLLSKETAAELKELLRYTVSNGYGDWSFPGLTVCAKSGTAEVGEGQYPHAWFTGFLDDPEHPYAFVVVVENGGSGLGTAGAVANTLLQAAVS